MEKTPNYFFLRLIIHHVPFLPFHQCFISLLAVSAAGKTLTVSDETEKTMKVTWQPAPGNVVNYRITYRPQQGGRQLAAKVPGGTTSTVLRRLTPQTTYDLTVVPIYSFGEGKTREGEGRTCMLQFFALFY